MLFTAISCSRNIDIIAIYVHSCRTISIIPGIGTLSIVRTVGYLHNCFRHLQFFLDTLIFALDMLIFFSTFLKHLASQGLAVCFKSPDVMTTLSKLGVLFTSICDRTCRHAYISFRHAYICFQHAYIFLDMFITFSTCLYIFRHVHILFDIYETHGAP